jgi:NAD(P)-dependent dehydrogenase (short-subunit alcohol dehydrogenase family)
MSFSRKVAIVAGAGGGMGLNIANDLIGAGAKVALTDIKERPDDIAAGPGDGAYHQGDVTDEAFVERVVAETVSAHGRLDYLVNTTGVLWFDRDRSLVDIDMAVWDRVLAINLKSHALTARHAIPAMIETGGGAMVHISSLDALRGDDKPQDAYGASKAAVIRLSKSIAIQFARRGIRSNTILPGPVASPMQARGKATTTCWRRSRTRCRSDASAAPRTSPTPACFCCPTRPASSPAPSSWSTAAARRNRDGPVFGRRRHLRPMPCGQLQPGPCRRRLSPARRRRSAVDGPWRPAPTVMAS